MKIPCAPGPKRIGPAVFLNPYAEVSKTGDGNDGSLHSPVNGLPWFGSTMYL